MIVKPREPIDAARWTEGFGEDEAYYICENTYDEETAFDAKTIKFSIHP
jgi:hypothetical protein